MGRRRFGCFIVCAKGVGWTAPPPGSWTILDVSISVVVGGGSQCWLAVGAEACIVP